MAKIKITVVKKTNNKDLFGDTSPTECTSELECPRVELGQEYMVEELGECPSGFCGWAYSDIFRDIAHLYFGGNYPWTKENGVALACCTDGCRPVIFRLERLED
jgi:uncharacterized repeat protein (TIGR04076 family)